MSEARFRIRLVRELRELGHIQPIESVTGPGIPDLNGCIEGVDFWIELKYFKKWPKKNFKSKLSEYQKLWLRTRWKNGGQAYYLAQIEKDYLLISGKYAMQLDELTVEEVIQQGMLWKNKLDTYDLSRVIIDRS